MQWKLIYRNLGAASCDGSLDNGYKAMMIGGGREVEAAQWLAHVRNNLISLTVILPNVVPTFFL